MPRQSPKTPRQSNSNPSPLHKDKPLIPERNATRFLKFAVFGLLMLQLGREMMLMSDKITPVIGTITGTLPPPSPATTSVSSSGKILRECSVLERHLVKRDLPSRGYIGAATACPISDAWLTDYLEEAPVNKDFVYLNFGCNKGFDSLHVANIVSRKGSVFDKKKWRESLPIQDKGGVCQQGADSDSVTPIHNESLPKRPVEVHCVEAMPLTVDLLNEAAKVTTAGQHGLFIHNYAMTGTEGGGTIRFPNPVGQAGHEGYGMGFCTDNNVDWCKDVPALTIDEFVAKHVDRGNSAGIERRIPFMTIDVEGFDFTLMKAGQKTLQRTDYLEFEYHNNGDWGKQKLEDAIVMLKSLGFFCYWSGRNKLWRITDCWQDHFGASHQWSNIACVAPKHQPKLARRMERVFQDTLEGKLEELFGPIPT